MHEHFGAIEADFQSHYGLDLREVLWGPKRYGARRLWSLLLGIPLKSAFGRSLLYHGQEWSQTDELIASLVEAVDHGNRLFYGANRGKSSPPVWDPVEIERPWKAAATPALENGEAHTSPEEIRNFFGEDIIHDYTPGPREGEE